VQVATELTFEGFLYILRELNRYWNLKWTIKHETEIDLTFSRSCDHGVGAPITPSLNFKVNTMTY